MDNLHKNISVIGIGRLGLAWALVLEKAGYNVIGCDIDKEYVKKINDKTFKTIEPQVNAYLIKAKNFVATCDLKLALSNSTMIFINVRTESDIDGKYDHSQLNNLTNSIIKIGKQNQRKHIGRNRN